MRARTCRWRRKRRSIGERFSKSWRTTTRRSIPVASTPSFAFLPWRKESLSRQRFFRAQALASFGGGSLVIFGDVVFGGAPVFAFASDPTSRVDDR